MDADGMAGFGPDSNIDGGRLLLGCVDWRHPAWEGGGYYPEDLPGDWRLGYYANDMGCVLLDAPAFNALDPVELEDAVDGLPAGFRFYIRVTPGAPADRARLDLVGGHLGAVLDPDAAAGHWRPVAGGVGDGQAWADADGELRLLVWRLARIDLRALRARLEALPPGLRALVIDNPALHPVELGRLRTLAELLGVA